MNFVQAGNINYSENIKFPLLKKKKRVLKIYSLILLNVVYLTIPNHLQAWTKIMALTTKFYRKVVILMYTKMFNFRPQSLKQLRNQNHTGDWALGCHSRYNGHVTH